MKIIYYFYGEDNNDDDYVKMIEYGDNDGDIDDDV